MAKTFATRMGIPDNVTSKQIEIRISRGAEQITARFEGGYRKIITFNNGLCIVKDGNQNDNQTLVHQFHPDGLTRTIAYPTLPAETDDEHAQKFEDVEQAKPSQNLATWVEFRALIQSGLTAAPI